MPSIQESLDEAQRQCQALTQEIQAFKDARILNEQATASLEATVRAMEATHAAIKPLTEQRLKTFGIVVGALTAFNTVLLITTLILVIVFK
jgi:hypothetical protein